MKIKMSRLAQVGRIIVGAALLSSTAGIFANPGFAEDGVEGKVPPAQGVDISEEALDRLLFTASNAKFSGSTKAQERLGSLMASNPKIRRDMLDRAKNTPILRRAIFSAAIKGLETLSGDQRDEFVGEFMDAVIAMDGAKELANLLLNSGLADSILSDQIGEAARARKADPKLVGTEPAPDAEEDDE